MLKIALAHVASSLFEFFFGGRSLFLQFNCSLLTLWRYVPQVKSNIFVVISTISEVVDQGRTSTTKINLEKDKRWSIEPLTPHQPKKIKIINRNLASPRQSRSTTMTSQKQHDAIRLFTESRREWEKNRGHFGLFPHCCAPRHFFPFCIFVVAMPHSCTTPYYAYQGK